MARARTYTHQGITRTFRDWLAQTGVQWTNFDCRYRRRAWPLDEALGLAPHVPRPHTGRPRGSRDSYSPRRQRQAPALCAPKPGRLQWCPTHAVALLDTGEWWPLPTQTVRRAQRLAAAVGCATQIRLTYVLCPQCLAQEEAA